MTQLLGRIIPLLIFLFCCVQYIDSKKAVSYLLNKPQCTQKSIHRIELVIARMAAIGPNGRKFPETIPQLKQFCRDTQRMVNQVDAFLKDCYQKEIRDYANILVYTIKANVRKYCGKPQSRVVRQLLQLAPCANKHVQPYDVCLRNFMNDTAQLINLDERYDQKKIPYGCCKFVEGMKCAEDFLNAVPCIRAHVPVLMDYFRSGAQSIVEIMCGEYNEQTDACQRLGPPPPPREPNRTRYVTFAFILIDLLESIKNLPGPGL